MQLEGATWLEKSTTVLMPDSCCSRGRPAASTMTRLYRGLASSSQVPCRPCSTSWTWSLTHKLGSSRAFSSCIRKLHLHAPEGAVAHLLQMQPTSTATGQLSL